MIDEGLGLAALLSLFGAVAFGAVVPVVPTGAAVSAAAVLAEGTAPWEVVLVVVVGAAGAYLGDVITYAVLRAFGEPLAHRVGWLNRDDPDGALARTTARIEQNEVRVLLLSRLVPGGRIPVLLAAALGGYPWYRFAVANVGAATVWAIVYAAIGMLGDALFPSVRDAVVAAVVLAVLATVALQLVKRLSPR
ncbi:MAG: VTT domain-containing protein [Nocardioidaceae bacterium]|nr:VTT domain-containing protein [Nocardioidaceae bacterium]